MKQLEFPTGVDVSTKSIALSNFLSSRKYEINLRDTVNFSDLFVQLLRILEDFPLTNYVGVDWSPQEAFWGARKSAQLKSLIVGILVGILMSRGIVVVWVPPSRIRAYYNLRNNASKSEVHQAAAKEIELSSDVDIADAQIIQLVMQLAGSSNER